MVHTTYIRKRREGRKGKKQQTKREENERKTKETETKTKENERKRKKTNENERKRKPKQILRSGRRPSPEGITLLFAGTISRMICPVHGQTEGRHDNTRRKTRQDNKRRGQGHRATKKKQNKIISAFMCPAGGPRTTQVTQMKAETKSQKNIIIKKQNKRSQTKQNQIVGVRVTAGRSLTLLIDR